MKTVYQNCWDLFKAMLKGKLTASNGYTTKKKKKDKNQGYKYLYQELKKQIVK